MPTNSAGTASTFRYFLRVTSIILNSFRPEFNSTGNRRDAFAIALPKIWQQFDDTDLTGYVWNIPFPYSPPPCTATFLHDASTIGQQAL
ncbi:hypothetical protein [Coleofasciculus sp. F4-SAH-05]|uniref:hypothetical protein n=1 Tax=Coleofasciculus TaxID=669368 RepID=UPI0032FE70E4